MATNSSNMNAVATTTPELITDSVKTKELILDSKKVTSISDDFEDTDPKTIPTMFAMQRLEDYLQEQITRNSKDIELINISPVISDPIISPNFTAFSDWQHTNFWLGAGRAEYVNSNNNQNTPQATLRIPLGKFTNQGTYFIYVVLSDITSQGKIEVTDHTQTVYKTLEQIGEYRFTVDVEDPNQFFLEFRVSNIPASGRVYFDAIYCYYIKKNIDEYVTFKSNEIASGGSNFASETYVDNKATTTEERANAYTDTISSQVQSNLDTHVNRIGNVHNATPSDLGAADRVHQHTGSDIVGSVSIADHVEWSGILNVPEYLPTGAHALSHMEGGTDPIQINASQITTGVISVDRLPSVALPTLITVQSLENLYTLTIDDVQLGDSVKVLDTNKLYAVIDVTNLDNQSGYSEYNATASWDSISGKPVEFTPTPHTHVTNDIVSFPTQLPNPGLLNIYVGVTPEEVPPIPDGEEKPEGSMPIEYGGDDDVELVLTADTLNVPKNTFNEIVINNKTITPSKVNDTLTITLGSNVSATINEDTNTITIDAVIPGNATITTSGLMSSEDKIAHDELVSAFRNITSSTNDPSVSDGEVGDIWIKVSE